MKKFFVIIVLFALPLVAYLFFASGVNNFARLPVLTQEVASLEGFENAEGEPVSFQNKISIVAFPGREPESFLTNAYHLAEKIYDPYHEFRDFQFVFIFPEEARQDIESFKQDLAEVVPLKNWEFVVGSAEEVKDLFSSLGSDFELDTELSNPHAFIVDKEGRLRGREDDEDAGKLYGYDARSVAVVNNKLNDDVKVILAEYRLELKKYKESQNNL